MKRDLTAPALCIVQILVYVDLQRTLHDSVKK